MEQLERFLREDPCNVSLIVELVTARVHAGQADRAQSLLDSMKPEIAAQPEVVHAAAVLRLAQHRYEEAARLLQGLVDAGAPAAELHFNLGYALFRLGRHEEAAEHLRTLASREDAPAATLAYLMRCLHHEGKTAEALAAWESASSRLKTAEAGGVAALACLDAGRLDEARQLADVVLAGPEVNVEALVARATIAAGEGDEPLAGRLLERAVAASPTDGRTWTTIASARLARGEIAAGEQAFLKATAFMPQHVGSWNGLAWCQLLRRDLDAAQASFETALALDRNFAETHGGLAVVAALQERRAEAEAAIERALRLDPNSLAARYAQAILDGKAQDAAAVRALAQRLLRNRPGFDGLRLLNRTAGGPAAHSH